ncbi:type VII secretion-associated serine protease mycosin [Micromonospora rifamycinica]|uniref:type VII secretion-associated serine protease mycosin n=1 Tax=Micromonospora rifamycinica TaxID=291594 RepID=UPI00076DE6E0|nr:type VII secretion-associated serine protease mycosin [Micromonospora rifamycinica]
MAKSSSALHLLTFIQILIAPTLTLPTEPPKANQTAIRQDQWHLKFLNTEKAHKISQGEGSIVAVLDTGVAPHPDLRGNLLTGIDTIPGGTGDGHSDHDSHGTGMAGLVAGHGQASRTGALGVAPKAKVLPILCSPSRGDGDPDALAEGIKFAIARSANIVSISSVGGSSPYLDRMITQALASNIIVVAAAGNYPEDTRVGYPATASGVIAVGGVDRNGNHASISVSGPEIDVVAPAVDIYSTSIDGKYRKGTGTSDATAIVAGAAALVRSKYPYLPAAEVVHRLTATAVDKGPPGRDDEYGYGVIDLVAALTADVPPLGFESVTAVPPSGMTSAAAQPAGGDDGRGAAARGWATLGVIVAAGCGFLVWRRRRRADDPPPRISR